MNDEHVCSGCGKEFEPEELTCIESAETTEECDLAVCGDICPEAYCEDCWEDE